MQLFSHAVFFAALLCSFLYGVAHSFRKKGVLFLQIVTCAAGCMMLGELFYVTELLVWKQPEPGFHVSMLGTMGSSFFLMSASYGQIDGLGDDRSQALRIYRIIPVLLPLLLGILAVIDWRSGAYLSVRVANLILMLPLMIASYFHLKHLIIPDIDLGILAALRTYNMVCIAIDILGCLRILFFDYELLTASYVMTILLAAAYLLLVPIAHRGVKRWFI